MSTIITPIPCPIAITTFLFLQVKDSDKRVRGVSQRSPNPRLLSTPLSVQYVCSEKENTQRSIITVEALRTPQQVLKQAFRSQWAPSPMDRVDLKASSAQLLTHIHSQRSLDSHRLHQTVFPQSPLHTHGLLSTSSPQSPLHTHRLHSTSSPPKPIFSPQPISSEPTPSPEIIFSEPTPSAKPTLLSDLTFQLKAHPHPEIPRLLQVHFSLITRLPKAQLEISLLKHRPQIA